MADVKITALTAIGLNPVNPATFPMPMVDLLDNSMAASGSTRKVTVNQILGSGGTATLASATITGALTVDTTTLVANAAGYTDKVGIGTATPAYLLDITDASVATRVAVTNTNNSAFGAGIYLKTMNGASMVSNATLATSNNGTFSLFTGTSADSTKLSVNTSGDVNIALGNVVMATSGKGIDFSATANSSGTMTSELLADYEEGTWVPTDASGAGLTFTVSACRYTKVGRTVTVQGIIVYPVTASTASATWGGFPFNSGDIFNLNIVYTDASSATLAYIGSNTVNAFLFTPGANVTNATVSGKTIIFAGTYMV